MTKEAPCLVWGQFQGMNALSRPQASGEGPGLHPVSSETPRGPRLSDSVHGLATLWGQLVHPKEWQVTELVSQGLTALVSELLTTALSTHNSIHSRGSFHPLGR